ncbi:type I-MYXAN CRISPR-associated protein Cas6/Cmx6 [Chromatium okenii]|uniref:type I-MYXAN CRISPR-associated protein Cas6/Cmx6 n=1 Tax=Chromatium okenii TaxID=61644 RepID=UPI002412F7D5|nr:type I-MYXAN CRISPR-associated protein Cas6/Cmx6 [Chromatium okenii]
MSRNFSLLLRSLAAMGIHIRKALCGKATALATPRFIAHAQFVLAALTAEESIQLQQHGLGTSAAGLRHFHPHKGIDSVKNG